MTIIHFHQKNISRLCQSNKIFSVTCVIAANKIHTLTCQHTCPKNEVVETWGNWIPTNMKHKVAASYILILLKKFSNTFRDWIPVTENSNLLAVAGSKAIPFNLANRKHSFTFRKAQGSDLDKNTVASSSFLHSLVMPNVSFGWFDWSVNKSLELLKLKVLDSFVLGNTIAIEIRKLFFCLYKLFHTRQK